MHQQPEHQVSDQSLAAGALIEDSVVDDATYDLLQALTSKLEAIEAYEQYVLDGDAAIFRDLLDDERRHAKRLVQALRERLLQV